MLLKDTRSLVKPLAPLSIFRASKCLDPRDKVYAFLSLWPEQVEAGSTENSMVADYAQPVPRVYMDAADTYFARPAICAFCLTWTLEWECPDCPPGLQTGAKELHGNRSIRKSGSRNQSTSKVVKFLSAQPETINGSRQKVSIKILTF